MEAEQFRDVEDQLAIVAPTASFDNSRLRTHARHLDRRTCTRRASYGPHWPKIRAAYLRRHPYCESFACNNAATQVDHITPFDQAAPPGSHQWDNLQALCQSCHSRKTVMRDGGFGREKVCGSGEGGES